MYRTARLRTKGSPCIRRRKVEPPLLLFPDFLELDLLSIVIQNNNNHFRSTTNHNLINFNRNWNWIKEGGRSRISGVPGSISESNLIKQLGLRQWRRNLLLVASSVSSLGEVWLWFGDCAVWPCEMIILRHKDTALFLKTSRLHYIKDSFSTIRFLVINMASSH